ncbi:hypothetical protein MRX96_031436 [Rhipicephalus microplus]
MHHIGQKPEDQSRYTRHTGAKWSDGNDRPGFFFHRRWWLPDRSGHVAARGRCLCCGHLSHFTHTEVPLILGRRRYVLGEKGPPAMNLLPCGHVYRSHFCFERTRR